jgi:hypothetical protein
MFVENTEEATNTCGVPVGAAWKKFQHVYIHA